MSEQETTNDQESAEVQDTGAAKGKTPPLPPKRKQLSQPNIVVELGDERNRTITVDTLKIRLRGRYSSSGLMAVSGRHVGDKLSAMPDIPGINIAVFLTQKSIKIFDPLATRPDLLERINAVGRKARQRASGAEWKPVKDVLMENVDDDIIKTLLLEINRHLAKEKPTMHIVLGTMPPIEQLEKLPGNELYDPWSNNPHKPKYVRDVPAWMNMQRIREIEAARVGG